MKGNDRLSHRIGVVVQFTTILPIGDHDSIIGYQPTITNYLILHRHRWINILEWIDIFPS